MLGEGFDLPELKIAAFHDIRKTLAVTLQLVFVKFGPGILAGHFELVGAGRFRIQNVEFLIQLWSHQDFDLKAIRVQRMHRGSPCLGYGLCVLRVLGNVGGILNSGSEGNLRSRYDRIFHDRSNPRYRE
jgi:hypothetical protein